MICFPENIELLLNLMGGGLFLKNLREYYLCALNELLVELKFFRTAAFTNYLL